MPIRPPAIDDRSFEDLRDELLARIPAHTPEWTNPRLGDPGHTLVEAFAWLTDTLLYRANLIPERQRLVFLRLLGIPLKPAIPARGLIQVAATNQKKTQAIALQPGATVKGVANFETRSELTALPIVAGAYYKRALSEEEAANAPEMLASLQAVYQAFLANRPPRPYVTTPIFADGIPDRAGFNFSQQNA